MTRILRLFAVLLMVLVGVLAPASVALAQDNDATQDDSTGQDDSAGQDSAATQDSTPRRVGVTGYSVAHTCTSGTAEPGDDLSAWLDTDNDGVVDAEDTFPYDATETVDSDGDCQGDSIDAFPLDPLLYRDGDSDRIADLYDRDFGDDDGALGPWIHCTFGWDPAPEQHVDSIGDLDSDGVTDADDAFPWNPKATVDSNEDCIDDDSIPTTDLAALEAAQSAERASATDLGYVAPCTAGADFSETRSLDDDQDGDGWVDSEDLYPRNRDEFADTDGDCVANRADLFPKDRYEWADSDGDGTGDNYNAVQTAISLGRDSDGDGFSDVDDPDDDNDGWDDLEDAFPADSAEWIDSDADGTGDNYDRDTDNDHWYDVDDAFPQDINEWIDTDGDGIGDNADPDDDDDGWYDYEDSSPTDPTEWEMLDAAELTFEELMTGDPELDAMLQEILNGGSLSDGYSSSGYGSTNSLYGTNSFSDYSSSTYRSSGSSSSGPSRGAIKLFFLLPLLLIRMVMRSGDK